MLKIFLSYARADGAEEAARLRARLDLVGFMVWQDIQEMRGGQAWQEQLRAALREVDVVLVLLTPHAVQSEHVQWEWENALTLQKRVIPLLILPCAVPEPLQRLHYHNLSTPDQYLHGFAALIRDLVELVHGRPETSTNQPPASAPKYVVHNAINSAIGDNAIVFNTGTTVYMSPGQDSGQDKLADVFARFMESIERLPAADQEDLKPVVQKAHADAQQLQQGKQDPELEAKLESRLERLYKVLPDVGEVALTTLISPVTGVALVIQKIAQRVREKVNSKK